MTDDILKQAHQKMAGQSPELATAVARTSKDPDLLTHLAGHSHWRVRGEVARNENTPPEILHACSTDSDPDIREGVAANLKTPLPTIQHLIANEADYRN